ncbi:telethonin-like [Protopterus annectens]|uniref:telethonin-like n=1 Tax=Protopterus annectens TaxID=7888 RepID=UPI001CFAD1F7|nr:telethonin-like [Protopterus annectens]
MYHPASENRNTLNITALSSNVEEQDTAKKEYYSLSWENVIMGTRIEERTTLSDHNNLQREHYEKKQQMVFLVQMSPDQKMKTGRLGEKMVEYQLPYKKVLPVPVFMPPKVQDSRSQRTATPEELRAMEKFENALSDETGTYKRHVDDIKKDMPKVVQPSRLNVRISSLLSPPPKAQQHSEVRH